MKRPSAASVVAWLAVLAVCACWPIVYDRIGWELAYLELMLLGHDVPLSMPARLVAAHRLEILRFLFGLSALAIVVKEPFVRDKRLSLILTLASALVTLLLAEAARAALSYPLQRSVVAFA